MSAKPFIVGRPLAAYPEVLTVEDVCAVLHVKRSWVYNDKTLPWFSIGRLKRLYRADLIAHIEAQRSQKLCDIDRGKAKDERLDVLD